MNSQPAENLLVLLLVVIEVLLFISAPRIFDDKN